jgi:hypothetical protein
MKKTHPVSEGTAKEIRTTRDKKAWDTAKKKAKVNMKQLKGKYNGVIGEPPEWLPDYLKEQFISIRSELLNKYSPEQILQYMQAQEETLNVSGAISNPTYPFKINSLLDSLIDIKNISNMGKDKGLEACFGKESQKTFQSNTQSNIAKKPRPNILRMLVVQVLQKKLKASYKEVKQELKNNDQTMVAKGDEFKLIERVFDDRIEWNDKEGRSKTTKTNSLKSLISSERKKIESQ